MSESGRKARQTETLRWPLPDASLERAGSGVPDEYDTLSPTSLRDFEKKLQVGSAKLFDLY
jgi:hypothetical protein